MKRALIVLGLLIILIIGSWFRLGGTISNSFAFTYDVGRDMLAVENIIVNHKISLIGQTTGVEGIFYGPWWYLILSVPFFIFSGNPQGIAFFMGIIGIATILLGYIVGKKVGGVSLGMTFSALISFSPMMISSSSQIWNPNLIPFFSVLTLLVLYSLFSASKSKNCRLVNFLFLGLLLGLIIDMEIVFGILLLLGICIALVFIFRKKIAVKEIALFLLGILLIFSPRIIFDIRHNFLMTKTFIDSFNNGLIYAEHFSILDVLLSKTGSLFNLWNAALTGQNRTIGFILIAIVLLSFRSFYKKIEKTQKKFAQTMFIIIATFLIGLTFFNQAVWPHYLVGLPVFYILLVSLMISATGIIIKKSWIIIVFVFVLFWINLNPLQVIADINKPLWEGNSAVYRNQASVVDYIYSDAKGKNFKYIVYTPAVHDYSYRYLFSWYGKKEYGYVPVQSNTKLLYVVLEPDYDMPFRLKDWLKIRENDGIIQREKAIRGGVVVQTRLLK